VIDFRLPKRTGIELVQDLLHSGVTTPALIFTGYPSPQAAGVAKGLGVDFLSKRDVTVREVVKFARSRATATTIPPKDRVGRLLRDAGDQLTFGQVTQTDVLIPAFVTAIVSRQLSFTDFMSIAEALRCLLQPRTDLESVVDQLHFLADRRAGRRRIAEAAGLESSFAHGASSAAASSVLKTGLGWNPRLIDLAPQMRSAVVELASTTEQVAQISNRLGYEHHAAFDRHFRNFFGCSPTTFRQLLKKHMVEGSSDSTRNITVP